MDLRARIVLAIDPGTIKCGIALVRSDSPPETLCRCIVLTEVVPSKVHELCETYRVEVVLIGDATGGKTLVKTVRETLPDAVPLRIVPEWGTSERARARYDRENPPRDWTRLLPAGLRTPPVPYDDYAAVILAEDWLAANPPPETQQEPRP